MNYKLVNKIFARFGNKKEKPVVLDFGCGGGRFLLEMEKNGWDAYGVDITKKEIEKAQKLLKENALTEDRARLIQAKTDTYVVKEGKYRLPFEDSFFDAIFSYQVFEHIYDLREVGEELARILKPGGVLYARFPAKYTPIEPHTFVPFVHWIPYSPSRRHYIDAFYWLGVSLGVYEKSRKGLGKSSNEYLRDGTFYRSWGELLQELGGAFTIKDLSSEVFAFEMEERGINIPGLIEPLCSYLYGTFKANNILLERK